MKNRKNAFTLVELLVVIAIISLLAGLLLPVLEDAIESARRIVCTGNQKQNHVAWSLYTEDFDDRMPTLDPFLAPPIVYFRPYNWITNSPFRLWAIEYAGVGSWTNGTVARDGMSRYDRPGNTNNILYCPSDGYNTNLTIYTSYSYHGIGLYKYGWCGSSGASLYYKVGTTRMSRMGEGSPVLNGGYAKGKYPFQFIGETEMNHEKAGGSATRVDGSVRWYDRGPIAAVTQGDVWSKGRACSIGMALQSTNHWTTDSGSLELTADGQHYIGYFAALGMADAVDSRDCIYRSLGYTWPPSEVATTQPTGP